MARALCAWAANRGGKNSVRNLQYGPRTRLVRGIYETNLSDQLWMGIVGDPPILVMNRPTPTCSCVIQTRLSLGSVGHFCQNLT